MIDAQKSASATIRERLNHPVLDGDGHTVEVFSIVLEYMREVGGNDFMDRFMKTLPEGSKNFDTGVDRAGGTLGWYGLTPQERMDWRVTRGSFRGITTTSALDRATAMLPNLFRERLDEFGIDYAIVYTSMGGGLARSPDPEVRRVGCRALNRYYMDIFGPHKDRMTPAAVIPMNTPEEAIEELEYAVKTLGFKVVIAGGPVRRQIAEAARRSPETAMFSTWIDVLAQNSMYDYDPFWKKCIELKVAPTSHVGSQGYGFRASTESFVYNHIGHFAAAHEAYAKALILGGVMRRFPELRIGFLEGGCGWATNLYNDTVDHWEKRNMAAMRKHLDPANLDSKAVAALFSKYGGKMAERFADALGNNAGHKLPPEKESDLDEWAKAQISSEADFAEFFSRFYFGCESDDRMAAVAFNPRLHHGGIKLKAFFSSDIGHFDVPDIRAVLHEAYELVEEELLTEDDFRNFTFVNLAKMHTALNPDFFKGTVVEDAVNKINAVPAR